MFIASASTSVASQKKRKSRCWKALPPAGRLTRPRGASRGLGLAWCGIRGYGQELDLEPLDARPDRLEHGEAEPVGDHLVTDLRRSSEMVEDVAGDGVVVVLHELCAELLVEVVEGERAVDPDRPLVDTLDRLVGKVELVLDLADDLL